MSKPARALYAAAAIAVVAMLVAAFFPGPAAQALSGADKAVSDPQAPKAVEEDMHEFMEYVFEPTYKRLRAVMATEPADKQAWKAVKAEALILAEGGNLLLFRQPDDDPNAWVGHSVEVRDFGGQLYAAARKQDYAAARKSYETMLKNCNACHDQFAGGEHQLEP